MLYIHIPFCKGKCIYCNFYSGGNPQWKRYIKAVAAELSSRIDELKGNSLSSIYIGGGTPSLIPDKEFDMLMGGVYSCLEKNKIRIDKDAEVTLEVNPEDVTPQAIEIWKEKGINRISMGVQSLCDTELKRIGRRHTARKALDAMCLINENFENYSVDIMYGLPGQSEESLIKTLKSVLEINPTHISIYSLTFEEGTPLTIFRDRGVIQEPSEEEYLKLGEIAVSLLKDRGFERYEISNYARNGFKSRHNRGYWTGKKYLGLGPSACSYDGKDIRRTNPSNLKEYLSYFENNAIAPRKFYIEELLTLEELMEERIFLSLRTTDGLDTNRFTEEFSKTKTEQLIDEAARWTTSGHIVNKNGFLFLTSKGFEISDYIILSLVGKIQ